MGFTEFEPVFLIVTGFFLGLLSFDEFDWVLPSFLRFYRVLPSFLGGFTGYCRVVTKLYQVLLGFTDFY